jgi:hypothetical protein
VTCLTSLQTLVTAEEDELVAEGGGVPIEEDDE